MKSKTIFTQADYKKAQAKWEKQLSEMKIEATSNATLFCQVVQLKALTMMGVSMEFLHDLQANQDKITGWILDEIGEHKEYSLFTAIEELKKEGIEVEGEWV